MIKKQFVICDKDVRYLYHIQDYLIRKKLNDFQIEVFDNIDKIIEYSDRQSFEIAVISETCFVKEKIADLKATHIFILKETSEPFEESYPCLDKYQSIENILKQILETYTNEVGEKRIQRIKKRSKIISFYSATQTTKQSFYAFAASQILSKDKKKVLYINLQPYSGLEELLQLDEKHDLTDLIYYALQHSDKFGTKLDNMKYSLGGLEMLPTARNSDDLLSMTKDEWQDWFEVMMFESGYEILVIDFNGTSFFASLLLKNSDLIYYINGTSIQERACDNQFHKIMQKKEWEKVRAEIRDVELYDESISKYEDLYLSGYGKYMKNELRKEKSIYDGTGD